MKYLLIIKILLEKIIKLNICFLKREISGYPKLVKEFENNFSNYIGKKFGLTFCNGTSSIEAALYALNLSKDDEVLVPSSTFHATLGPIINLSLKPVFVDIDPHTLTVDCNDIRKKITSRCKALLIVHPWGYPCNMNEIQKISREFKLKLIEDCSHAHGATFDGKKVGSFGDIGCFSLQGAKAIAAGEGGITVTDNYDYFLRMSLYGHFNRNEKDLLNHDNFRNYAKTGLSKKLRAHPLGISLATADLENIEKINQYKQDIYNKIDKILDNNKNIKKIKVNEKSIRGGFFNGYPCIIDNSQNVEKILSTFQKNEIKILSYPWLMHHKMSLYTDDFFNLVTTEKLSKKIFFIQIPYFLNFDFTKFKKVIDKLNKIN
jgi:perosamine synthetase